MKMKHTTFIYALALLLAVQGTLSTSVSAEPVTVDSKTIERLENLINNQQKQLEALQQEVNQLKQQQIQPPAVSGTVQGPAVAPPAKVVTSGEDKVKLAISGQINRAINIADDGDKTDAYFVDSDVSNTRVRFVGTALIDEDLTLGTKLELAFAPNESGDVSQDDQESGDFNDQRYAELTLMSKRYGMLYLGKGDTSSNSTAEVDLSGTDLIQYASTADIVGGLFFRQSGDDELTDITVAGAFKDFDGLSRKSRLRYDTPNFHGFGLSGSVISDRRWDTALRWGGDGYGLKAAAAAAVAYINEDEDPGKGLPNADYQYDGSFSVLHEATGLNVTLSAGTKDADNQTDPYNLWGKIGWLTSLNSFGKTAFGIDYGHSENIAADDYEGDTFGVAVVQNFDKWATQVYFQFRNFSLDTNDDPNVSDINVGTLGARVKF